MATKSKPLVTLTRQHRAAIYAEVDRLMSLSGDITIHFDHEADREWITQWAERQMPAYVRLLDQLGWQRDSDRETYELEVDETVLGSWSS